MCICTHIHPALLELPENAKSMRRVGGTGYVTRGHGIAIGGSGQVFLSRFGRYHTVHLVGYIRCIQDLDIPPQYRILGAVPSEFRPGDSSAVQSISRSPVCNLSSAVCPPGRPRPSIPVIGTCPDPSAYQSDSNKCPPIILSRIATTISLIYEYCAIVLAVLFDTCLI